MKKRILTAVMVVMAGSSYAADFTVLQGMNSGNIAAAGTLAAPEAGFAAAVRQEAGQSDAELVNGLADLVAAEVKDFIKYRVTTAADERKKLACLADPKTRKTPFVERTCDEHGCDAVGAEYIGVQCGKDQLTVAINTPGSKFKVITEVRKNNRENYLVYLPRAPKDAVTHEELAKSGALVGGALFPEAFKRGIPVGVVKGLEALSSGEGPAVSGVIPVVDGTAKSIEELSFPEYCRINDRNLAALAEEVMTKDSPRDPATGNLFIELAAAGPGGQQLKARVVNVRHAHPGDQFHIELYVGGRLLFKSGRQDNPIFIGFQVDGEPFSLTCFEDIPRSRPPFPVDTDPYLADQASEVIFNWLSADPDANMPALQAWMAANGVQDGVVEFIYNKKHAEKRAEFARTLQG